MNLVLCGNDPALVAFWSPNDGLTMSAPDLAHTPAACWSHQRLRVSLGASEDWLEMLEAAVHAGPAPSLFRTLSIDVETWVLPDDVVNSLRPILAAFNTVTTLNLACSFHLATTDLLRGGLSPPSIRILRIECIRVDTRLLDRLRDFIVLRRRPLGSLEQIHFFQCIVSEDFLRTLRGLFGDPNAIDTVLVD